MKVIFVLAVVFAVAHAASLEEQWQEFKLKHGKSYKSLIEEKRRFTIFQDNIRQIEEHNLKYAQGTESYTKGINQFTDMTHEEFVATLTPMPPKPKGLRRGIYNDTKIVGDSTIDYVKAGLVTSVKNQKRCGGCWAFSTVGSIEGQVAKSTGKLVSLSAQNLIDCDEGNMGCNGGLMDTAFEYCKKNGVLTEEEYPFTGKDGDCRKQGGQKVSGYIDIDQSEEALFSSLSTVGPISIALNANYLSPYSGGIFTTSYCTEEINHGILLVGAGNAEGKDYWLIKNSWGEDWGENGYFRMERGKKLCGIHLMNSYPTLYNFSSK